MYEDCSGGCRSGEIGSCGELTDSGEGCSDIVICGDTTPVTDASYTVGSDVPADEVV
jgi:hypothetical protein